MNQVKDFFEYIFNAIKIWIIVQPWERGIRVRSGKTTKKLSPGVYFRIPYFDSVYKQEIKLRVGSLPVQTLTTKDGKTITLNGAFGYSISDIEKLYNTLYHPETTVRNIIMSEVGNYIFQKTIDNIEPRKIEDFVLEKLKESNYGISFDYFKITNFAIVRTYRLIQDTSWIHEGLKMDIKV